MFTRKDFRVYKGAAWELKRKIRTRTRKAPPEREQAKGICLVQ